MDHYFGIEGAEIVYCSRVVLFFFSEGAHLSLSLASTVAEAIPCGQWGIFICAKSENLHDSRLLRDEFNVKVKLGSRTTVFPLLLLLFASDYVHSQRFILLVFVGM